MIKTKRNTQALSQAQIDYCETVWDVLKEGHDFIRLDCTRASQPASLTSYKPDDKTIYVGANVFPAINTTDPHASLSVLACLAHELAHAERDKLCIRRNMQGIEYYIEEVEACLHASCYLVLNDYDRQQLYLCASDILCLEVIGYDN
ncbi:MAG: hypothetical protein LBV04_03280 [Deferribacteraceae bacterium]|nr:hypothetical protein [Deferribacteraceae bacterium]